MAADQTPPALPEQSTSDGAPISSLSAVAGVFVQPRRTFERLASKPRFMLPLLLVVLAQVVFGVALFRSGVIRNDAVAKMEAEGRPAEQIDQMEQFFESPAAPVIGAVSGGVAVAFVILVSAGLALFMGNLMLGARVPFKGYLCIVSYASLLGLVDQAIRTAIAGGRGTLDVRLGLGNLLGEEIGYFGRVLDTLTNPLVLWPAAISALGVAVFAKKGFGFGVLAVLPGFLLGVLLSGMR